MDELSRFLYECDEAWYQGYQCYFANMSKNGNPYTGHNSDKEAEFNNGWEYAELEDNELNG